MKPLHGPVSSRAEEVGLDLAPVDGIPVQVEQTRVTADGIDITGWTEHQMPDDLTLGEISMTASTWLPGDPIPPEYSLPPAFIAPSVVEQMLVHDEVPAPVGTILNPAVDILDMTMVETSYEFTYHDVPGEPGWKEARPVPSDKTHRLDIRINDRIVYSQDVDEYQLEHTQDAVLLSATRNGALSKVETAAIAGPTGTPLTAADAPADSAPAPDADVDDPKASDADSAEPPVVETVHTGERDVAADEAQRKADRAARREAAKAKTEAEDYTLAQPDGAAE